jgi:hypothetical protein
MLYLYWSKAMDTTDEEDPQLVQLAAVAQARAEQIGYPAPASSTEASRTDTLHSDSTASNLPQYGTLFSKNGKYEAEMKDDGKLVVVSTEDRQQIWSSKSSRQGTAPYRLVMQSDANLCIYSGNGFYWESGTNRMGTAPYKLVMQNDGNLCIYDGANRFIWGSFQSPQ